MSQHVKIERMSYGPDGIGSLENGKTVFVPATVPGDLVSIDIVEEKPSYARGKLIEILEPSPHRIAPISPHDAQAGTADWQHIDYPFQLDLKRQNVVSSLSRKTTCTPAQAEQLVQMPLSSNRTWHYRNKLELACSRDEQGRIDVGFHKEGSHEFVPMGSTMMVHKAIEKLPKALRGALRYAEGSDDLGIFRIGVRHSLATNDLEIALWTKPGSFPRSHIAQTIESACKATGIIRVQADPGSARKVKGIEVLHGYSRWHERLYDFDFFTTAPSFFQVNTAQAQRLIGSALNALGNIEGAYIADLYAGGGTFSIPLAAAGANVVAIESASSSVKDLRNNAEANGVFIDVIGGDAVREIEQLKDLDALVVDPPRAGLASTMAASIAAAHPEFLIYISCDPATWVRDVQILHQEGYKLQNVTPVDMFPQTYHIELVSIFKATE